MDTRRFNLVIAYDGTDYYGWQVQRDLPTVAQALQDSFKRVFFKDIVLVGASRTDAGVHALDQLATFVVDLPVSAEKILWAWRNTLPADILLRSVQEVDLTYNLFESVEQKTYMYHFFVERPFPLLQRYGWFIKKKMDISTLQEALNLFVGTHDFRSFSTGDERGDDTIRTVDFVEVWHNNRIGAYRVCVQGRAFLRHMVRRVVGAAFDASTQKERVTIDFLRNALQQRNPCLPLTNAPAKGLLLYEILLKQNENEVSYSTTKVDDCIGGIGLWSDDWVKIE